MIVLGLFLYPMWDSENQRFGLKACSPNGYLLYEVAQLIGFMGLVSLVVAALAYLVIHSWHYWWLLLIPYGIGIVGRLLSLVSFSLVAKKQFSYDENTMTVKWIEEGEEQLFPKT